MRALLKIILILICIFGSTFILGRVFGILTIDNVRMVLTQASEIEPIYVIGVVILLLFADLVIAVPTLTITLLAGYFLGFLMGALTAFTGMSLAVIAGYFISAQWGDKAIAKVIKDQGERKEMRAVFLRNSPVMIILSRAAPMIPEVCACLAGATSMAFWHYYLYFIISSLPYAMIAAYAGSISSIADPRPAIYAALSLYAILWLGWFIFQKMQKNIIKK